MVANEASKGMGPDEESFNVPVPVAQKVVKIREKSHFVVLQNQ